FNAGGGTVNLTGVGTAGAYTYFNVTVSAGTRTATGVWVVSNGLTLTGGTFAPGNFVHQVAGNWNDSAVTFTPPAGTIQLTSANPSITTLGTNNFFNLTLNNGATMASAITVTGTLTMSAGVVTPGNFVHKIAGNWNDTSVVFQPAAGQIQLTSANPSVTQTAANYFFDIYFT